MILGFRPLPWVLLGVGLLVAGVAPAEDLQLRLHGSNTLGSKLAPALLEAYAGAQGFTDIKKLETAPAEFTVTGHHADGRQFRGSVRAHGTNTGYADLLANQADVWMASRAASADEAAAAVTIGSLHSAAQEHVVALDGLAIAVHPDNPVRQLSIDQIRAAFSGHLQNWSQLGGADRPITLYARDANSGTFDSFKSMVLSDGSALAASAKRFESSSELERAIAHDPDALGFVGFSYLQKAHALAVFEGPTLPLKPDALTVATEDYLLARRLYFYTAENAPPQVLAFIEFVLGPTGQTVAAQTGFVSQNIFTAKETPPPGNPEGYYAVVDAAERLSLNFRFRAHSSVLDSRALRDIERLSAYMKDPSNRHKQLRLAAFGIQHDGGSPAMVMFSVNDRVDHIAQVLGTKGVATFMSRGFVGGALVAPPSEVPEQRVRNERVEVWVVDPKA